MNPPDRRTSPRVDPSMLEAPRTRDLSGTKLGDFEVGRLLGRGGMGEVYLGRQISLNREVAIKVLRADLAANATYVRRFEVEAWSAAKLNHPNIVQIYLLGEAEGLRFLVMEYVQGTNLREYLIKKGRAEDLNLALAIMKQAGMAVGAAGEVGLVHRDVKPENLLITKRGVVKVADFGLSRNLDDEEHDVTLPGVTIGTPLYMSPEQARGLAMDHRSDLYSLGVTFYHLLAGDPPFRADTALALAMKHVSDRPVDLAVHRPDLPADLVRLVMRLIAKAPVDRYQSAAEMLRDLARIREALAASGAATAAGAAALGSAEVAVLAPAAPPTPTRAVSGVAKRVAPSNPDGTAPAEAAEPRRPWPDRRLVVPALAASLALGLGLGWLSRPADLLTEDAGVRRGRPAAWLAPDWAQVARQPGAAAQYRHAQLLPAGPARDAAWVAVAEHFPADLAWSAQAYTQIARELFRRGDGDRLEAFARALRRTGQGRDEALAGVAEAGVAALDGDAEKVLQFFGGNNFAAVEALVDPALADLGLEVALLLRDDRRREQAPNPAGIRAKLAQVQVRLIRKLIETRRGLPD